MSCLPNTPVVTNVLSATNSTDQGWISLGAIIATPTALSQYHPLSTSVLTFSGTAQTSNQHMLLRQIEFEETASSSANIKKTPLLVLVYNNASPTAPTSGAVYNGSTTGLVGAFQIAEADYVRISDTVWSAVVYPNRYFRTGTSALASTLYAVVLSNKATSVTYAADSTARVNVFTEACTAL